MTYETARRLALALPGVEEGTCFGTPACRVGGKLISRLKEDGETLVLTRIGFEERLALMERDPKAFYITDHYMNYPSVLVRLSAVKPDELRELIERAWRRAAPKRLIAAFDAR